MAEYIEREAALQIIDYAKQLTSEQIVREIGTYELLSDTDKACYDGIIAALDMCKHLIKEAVIAADVQPIDKDNMHIIYIGKKAYLAENTIMEFMKKMDIIRDSLTHIENYFDTYAETIQQINACRGRCTDITEVKYFIDRIKENSGYD